MELKNSFPAPSSLFLINSILFFSIFLLVFDLIPFCLGQENNNYLTRYTDCNRNFVCGKDVNIGFPFWGNDEIVARPYFCGYPGYRLDCSNDNVTEIEIMSAKFRVFSINPDLKIMRITRKDIIDDADTCPSQFHNTTLNVTNLSYAPGVVNLTLYFDCSDSIIPRDFPYKFKCQTNDTNTTSITSSPRNGFGYFWIDSVSTSIFQSCSKSVKVPIMGAAFERLTNNLSTLSIVLKEGFDVNYVAPASRDKIELCDHCGASGGICGFYDSISLESFTCFCSDGSNRTVCDDSTSRSAPDPGTYLPSSPCPFFKYFAACTRYYDVIISLLLTHISFNYVCM